MATFCKGKDKQGKAELELDLLFFCCQNVQKTVMRSKQIEHFRILPVSNKPDQSGTFETLFERRSEVWTCGSSSDLATASIFGSQTDRWERRQGKAKARPSCKSFSQLLPAYHSSQGPDTDGSVTPRTSSPLQSTLH